MVKSRPRVQQIVPIFQRVDLSPDMLLLVVALERMSLRSLVRGPVLMIAMPPSMGRHS
jgi:uncharacterized protein YggT (Ycf19 family)